MIKDFINYIRPSSSRIIVLFTTIYLIFFLQSTINSQVDTTQLKQIVDKIPTLDDHHEFWKNLYKRDQAYRGVKTSKINDLENLISATYYLNKFGYPAKNIKAHQAMPLIWIHASYPKVNQVAFPIIIAGLKAGQISEKNIRIYYVRNKHWRKHFNEDNRTKDLYELFADLNLSVDDKIHVNDILTAYNESEKFLNQDFKTIGHWKNPKEDTTVKILKSEDGEYYYHNLYIDGSYFPEKIVQDKKSPNLFRNCNNPNFYFGIQPNGNLTIKNSYSKYTIKPVETTKKDLIDKIIHLIIINFIPEQITNFQMHMLKPHEVYPTYYLSIFRSRIHHQQ